MTPLLSGSSQVSKRIRRNNSIHILLGGRLGTRAKKAKKSLGCSPSEVSKKLWIWANLKCLPQPRERNRCFKRCCCFGSERQGNFLSHISVTLSTRRRFLPTHQNDTTNWSG